MSSDNTTEALGLLAAVQDPKKAKAILEEIRAEQTKLSEARKEFAAERRECAKIKRDQIRMGEIKATLEAYAVELKTKEERLKASMKRHEEAVRKLANIQDERREADKKVAYAKRKMGELKRAEEKLAEREEALRNTAAEVRVAVAEAIRKLD